MARNTKSKPTHTKSHTPTVKQKALAGHREDNDSGSDDPEFPNEGVNEKQMKAQKEKERKAKNQRRYYQK